MHRRDLRFAPPRRAAAPELPWVLQRAFGPPQDAVPPPPDPRAAIALAEQFDLAHRICSRVPPEVLLADVGPRPLARLMFRLEEVRELARLAADSMASVAAAAAERAIPIVWLKYAALRTLARIPDGRRGMGDIDVLAPGDRIGELAAVLRTRGFTDDAGAPDAAHHLRLRSADGVVEVHPRMPGVRLASGAGDATVADLQREGLVQPAGETSALEPSRPVVVAHLLAHGLAQHGMAPDAYPGMRLIADLLDLGIAPTEPDATRAISWVAQAVTLAEANAALGLAAQLGRGDLAATTPEASETAEALLLRHLVAGTLDRDYCQSLRLLAVLTPNPGGPRTLLGRAWAAAIITRSQVDAIYGRPSGRWGYLGWQLYRPMDLIVRAGRSVLARRRVRRRDSAGA